MMFTIYRVIGIVTLVVGYFVGAYLSLFSSLVDKMQRKGAVRILIKPLANNDNSKQQVYLGADFDVIRALPSGEVYSDGVSKKGPIFKAPLNFFWISLSGETVHAPNAQIILYPKYPETRLSGFLKGSERRLDIVPSHLMQPPTLEQRAARQNQHRYLVLGVNHTTIWAYCTSWTDDLQNELNAMVAHGGMELVASVFYEYRFSAQSSKEKLIEKLVEIYQRGPIESCRLNANGEVIAYQALNGAGYTLEAQFGITPNGSPDPDFLDWELKCHSGGAVTLMTPEPNVGSYLDDLEAFIRRYGTRVQAERLDFASRHNVGIINSSTSLTMYLEGYDQRTGKVTDPEGGLMLRDLDGHLAAGWKYEKLIEHWKNKHANTCFVSYQTFRDGTNSYQFGPNVTLGKGTSLEKLLRALHSSTIYYDPGVNMKLIKGRWRPKKRNQFRVGWRNIGTLYTEIQHLTLA